MLIPTQSVGRESRPRVAMPQILRAERARPPIRCSVPLHAWLMCTKPVQAGEKSLQAVPGSFGSCRLRTAQTKLSSLLPGTLNYPTPSTNLGTEVGLLRWLFSKTSGDTMDRKLAFSFSLRGQDLLGSFLARRCLCRSSIQNFLCLRTHSKMLT